mmetsp:Transcript_37838/g.90527  ORF Transcript_37838/g.90527 Transcript_37838/m.90527 type:complete len:213 (-) Transcript_37838:921-1559(-)
MSRLRHPPLLAICEYIFLFRPMSIVYISATPYILASIDMVQDHELFVVRTKYRARRCRCSDVIALAMTSSLLAVALYDSSFDALPVPCWTSPTFCTTVSWGSSFEISWMNSGQTVGSSLVTITCWMSGSILTKLRTASRYTSSGGQSSSPPAEPVTLWCMHLSDRRMGTPTVLLGSRSGGTDLRSLLSISSRSHGWGLSVYARNAAVSAVWL